MSMDIKLSKAQIFKKIQSSGSFSSYLSHHQLQYALSNGIIIPIPDVSTSNLSHHQLQYVLSEHIPSGFSMLTIF